MLAEETFITSVKLKFTLLLSFLFVFLLFRCKVAFLNTDQIEQAHEVINGNSFHNEGEAKIINTV